MKKHIALYIALLPSALLPMNDKPSWEERYKQAQEHVELLAQQQDETQSPFFIDLCNELRGVKDIIEVKSFKVGSQEEAKTRVDRLWEVMRSTASPLCDAALNHPTLSDDRKYAACHWMMRLTAITGKYLEQLPVKE